MASRGPGEIEALASSAVDDGHRRVIVVGGDGSVHEALNGILSTDGSVELGIIPVGTGNDFAKASSIPMHWEHATALLADRISSNSPGRPVDAGRCNSRYFANGAGIGFDAKVADYADRIRLPIGDLVYLIAVFQAMRSGTSTPNLTMTHGAEIVEGSFTLANFANGPWVGGMFHIAPAAQNDDGLLDLVYAEALSGWRIMKLLPRILRGDHLDEPELHASSVRKCEIVADQPVLSHLDGEVQAPQTHFSIEVLPGAFRLL
jgi:YegS/Rv2252/BmrU family lipid kinase